MADDAPFADEDAEENAPVIPNAADPGHQRRIRGAGKRAEAERALFWRGVFASEVGRREMWDIINTMHFHKDRFCESGNGSPFTEATWAEAGIQRIGFQLYRKWLGMEPEKVLLMLRENDPALR